MGTFVFEDDPGVKLEKRETEEEVVEQELQAHPNFNTEPPEFDFWKGLQGFPGDAKRILGETWEAFKDPIGLIQGTARLGASGLEKFGRNFEEFYLDEEIPPTPGAEAEIDATIDYYKDRYGDGIGPAFMDKPAETVLDALTLLSPAKVPSTVLKAPLNVARTAAKPFVNADTPNRMVQQAAKFGTTVTPAKRKAMADTVLEERINFNQKGVDHLDARIQSTYAELDKLIQQYPGGEVPVDAIFQHLNELRRTKGGVRIDRVKELAAIDKMVGEFRESLGNKKTVSAAELQDFKKDAYDKINWEGKDPSGTPIRKDTLKTVARGAKDTINRMIPEAVDLNASLSKLYELQNHFERSTSRISNRNTVGIGAPIKGTAGATVGGAVGGATGATIGGGVGFIQGIMDMPRMKTRLAHALDRVNKGDWKWIADNGGLPEVMLLSELAILQVEEQKTE